MSIAHGVHFLLCTLPASPSLPCSTTFADEAATVAAETPSVTAPEESWTFDVFVYYWSASVAGDVAADGDEVDNVEGGDGFSGDSALSGFLGHFEAHHGPWSYALAPIFVKVEASGDESTGVDADVAIRAQVHEAFVSREINGGWSWMAGARFYAVDTDVDVAVGTFAVDSDGSSHSWLDPIVGVRFSTRFAEHWSLHARADVGGFGVGSDFAWNAIALVGYHFSEAWSVELGYRALSVDYETGSGADEFAFNLAMYGPIIGVAYSF
jgi:hypothetical protein